MSNSELMLDVGQANELKLAFRRAGCTGEDVKRLCEKNGVLEGLKDVLRGSSEIVQIEYLIDCTADPLGLALVAGREVEAHSVCGFLKWEPGVVELYYPDHLYNGVTSGLEIREEVMKVKERIPLNACVLDYLLNRPFLIPEGWKEWDHIAFFGTVYREADGTDVHLSVPCMAWEKDQWRKYWKRLDDTSVLWSPVPLIARGVRMEIRWVRNARHQEMLSRISTLSVGR